MRKIVKKTLAFINLFFALLLVSSYLAAFIGSPSFYIIGFLGMAYPGLVFINFLFFVFWIIMLKRYLLISLIAILIRFDYPTAFVQFSNKPEESTQAQPLKVCSFNVHAFLDLEEWKRNSESIDKTVALLETWQPNIVCFQEFFSSTKKGSELNAIEKIRKQIPLKYYYIPKQENKEKVFGNIIFSAYPILNSGIVEGLPSKQRLVFADLLVEDDTLRFYNLHLTSFKLDEEDSKTFLDITENHNFEKEKSITLLRKIKTAQKWHIKEVELLKKHMENCKYEIFICGDFNDTPSSYPYQQLKKGKKDSFVEKGKGLGNTYNGKFPTFRIDYILHDKSFKTLSFTEKPINFSDHFPIFAVLEKK